MPDRGSHTFAKCCEKVLDSVFLLVKILHDLYDSKGASW